MSGGVSTRPPEIDHEAVVLGCAVDNAESRARVVAELVKGDFYRPAHQALFAVLADLHAAGAAAGVPAVNAELHTRTAPDGRPMAEVTGGDTYVFDLWSHWAVVPGGLDYHLAEVRQAASRRAIKEKALRLADAAGNAEADLTHATLEAIVGFEQWVLGTDRWPDPVPLGAPVLPVLPVARLPGVWGEITAAVAGVTQTPPDLAAAAAITVVSAATRGMWRVYAHADWSESLALYTAGIAESGTRKTAVLDLVDAPFRQREAEVVFAGRARFSEERAAYDIARGRAERAARDAIQASADRAGTLEAEARSLAAAFAQMGEPSETQWWVDDIGPESLGTVMAANEDASFHSADEGGMIEMFAGRYSGRPNLELILRAYDGTRPVRVNRIGRGKVFLERPFLAVALIVQPDVMATAAGVREMRERGFLPRFLFTMPATNLGSRPLYAPPMPDGARTGWDACIRRILDTSVELARRDQGKARLLLDRKARDLFDAWRDSWEKRLHPERGDLGDILSWASKMQGKVLRVGGNLTLADDPARTLVGEAEMAAGVELADYWAAHARAALVLRHEGGPAADAVPVPVASVARWLLGHRAAAVSVRDVWQGVRDRAWATKTDDVRAALGVLEEYGWVRVVTPRQAGRGRPSPTVEVNPKVWRDGGRGVP